MYVFIMLTTLIFSDLKEDQIVINETIELANPDKMVVVIDNINGDVEVERSTDNKVYLTLTIEMTAGTEALLQKAKKELRLGKQINDDSIVFFTKAPFVKKCKWGSGSGYDMRDQPNYDFRYQYTLKVPNGVVLEAKTINRGDVFVENMDGPIKAHNVNGEVTIKNARKVLAASTVNGDVTIDFLESPSEAINFNTVNGDFNFVLPGDFNAQVFFDSMNGDLFTAFAYRTMAPKLEKSKKGTTYKIGTKTGIQIGDGGPELSFRSINGNVYLKKSE